MVEFKRARKVKTDLGVRSEFDSRCGNYRITKYEVTLGKGSVRWYAMRISGRMERIISIHRKRGPAEAAIKRVDERIK